MNFYICKQCSNIITSIGKSEISATCCGQSMELLKVGNIDAAKEKHIPVMEIKNDSIIVKVGEITHPMTEEHLIQWIALETESSFIIEYLKKNEDPTIVFHTNQKIKNVYSYCNLHGLWVKEL